MNLKPLAAVALSFVALSAFAADGKLTPAAASKPMTVGQAVRHARERAHAARGGVRPNVIILERRSSSFLIPAAGSVQGANGVFFRSDLTFANYEDAKRNIGVGFLVAGQDNTNEPLVHFTLDALSVTTVNDFVGTGLNRSGLGALVVFAFDSTGTELDDEATTIDGFSRIWTPQPGSAGTVSQSFPAVSLFDSVDNTTAYALGLRQGSAFRTNAGIVNLDSAEHTWTVTSINTGATMTVTVKPFSLSQPGVPASFAGSSGNLSLAFDVPDTEFTWSAYASSVDNVTGDGWVARATQ
ncbi:MAG TPA: hypothetical protein VJZ76_07855 [Thermoanaerobaculia bacterium]|nr:hypothetical protein [Thermoanaerobaculia bacterium]